MKKGYVGLLACASGILIGLGISRLDLTGYLEKTQEQEYHPVERKVPESVESKLKDPKQCWLCGSDERSMMDYFRKFDDLGVICTNHWYVMDMHIRNHDEDGNLTGPQGNGHMGYTGTGLCYLTPNKEYKDNGIARVLNFAGLVPPEQSRFFNWSKPFVQLETTRGCFNTCAFCVSGGEKPVRTLSIESIRERLQLIHAHGIKNVRVLDRTFNYNPRRAKELLRLFLEFHPDIRFHLEIHPALLSEELKEELSLLPKGLLHLEAGIQSLREPVLEKSRRMGKLSDALDGLKFLCALPNMETHADLIAGLPLYHLHEIFEDVRTLAGYAAGEIQLESLKLLPGTEMRRRAEELGIKYSPLPPYEVLQTHEISVSELQTARQLSRLLDGFYNTPAWQALTRELILNDEQFLHRFLAYLTKANLIDQPMSLEKRGLILYEFCKQNYPEYQIQAAIAWIEAGMSLKKLPAEKVWTKRQIPPATWNIIYGEYKESLRLCFLPADEKGEHGYWFGFESEIQKASPVFKART